MKLRKDSACLFLTFTPLLVFSCLALAAKYALEHNLQVLSCFFVELNKQVKLKNNHKSRNMLIELTVDQ